LGDASKAEIYVKKIQVEPNCCKLISPLRPLYRWTWTSRNERGLWSLQVASSI